MPVVALTNRRTFFGLYAPEVLVILFGLVCWQLFALFGVPLRRPIQLYFDKIEAGLVSYPACLVLALALLRMNHIRHAAEFRDALQAQEPRKPGAGASGASGSKTADPLSEKIRKFFGKNNQLIPYRFTWGEFRRLYLNPRVMIFDLRMIHAISTMFVVFINLKHIIPWVNSAVFDQNFAQIEFQTFGKLMTVWMVQKIGTGVAPLLSDGYEVWYTYVLVSCLVLIMQRNRLLAEEFCTAFILMWLLAIVVVYLMPSWGPCFYYREQLAGVVPLTKMAGIQDGLWRGREFVLANPTNIKGVFLISGFPSLHFAATILGTYYFWRINRTMTFLSLIFAVITFFTTIYFGWHYLMDDIGAVMLVAIVIILVRRFYRTDLVFIEPRPQMIKMGSF